MSWPSARSCSGEVGDLEVGLLERGEVGELAADVDVDAHDLDAGKARGLGIDLRARAIGMPNLFSFLPVAIFSWVLASTSGLTRRVIGAVTPEAGRHLRQRAQLRFAFDVELADAAFEREAHLLARLADAGEDDALAGHARGAGAQVFAARHHVHPRAEIAERLEHGDVRERLDGEADGVGQGAQRLFEQAVVAGEGGGGVAVEGRADRGRDVGQGHVLGMELAVAVEEVVHGGLSARFGPGVQHPDPRDIGNGSSSGCGRGCGARGRAAGRRTDADAEGGGDGDEVRPSALLRAVSATIQTVSAMAAMVRSQVRPVVEALTYQASIRPDRPVPVSRM